MNIEELTLKQIREIQSLCALSQHAPSVHPLIGRNVVVRTVTMIYTGRLVDADADTLTLIDCSWIPETERYMQFVENGAARECEPYPDGMHVYINRGALLDMCELRNALPRSQK
jgi:hypothetical protein